MEKKQEKFKEISYAIIAGYFANYIQEGVARFFHDFTNTEYIESDRTGSILSSLFVVTSLEILRDKTSLINSTIFATGLSSAIIELYDSYIEKREFNYDQVIRKFLTDATILPIILTIYIKFLNEIKKYKKRDYDGAIAKVVKEIVYTFPIIVYYGYFLFKKNLEDSKKNEIKKIDYSLPKNEKVV